MADYIRTYTGKHYVPSEPDPALFCIEDFAHALSLLCRGNGHVTSFWSVGEHCILCAREAEARGLPALEGGTETFERNRRRHALV